MYVCMCVFIYIYMHAYIYMYVHTYIHIYMHIDIVVCVQMLVVWLRICVLSVTSRLRPCIRDERVSVREREHRGCVRVSVTSVYP